MSTEEKKGAEKWILGGNWQSNRRKDPNSTLRKLQLKCEIMKNKI